MRRPHFWRVAADLATLANGLSGAGAVAYILLGNKPFGLFLILVGVGWDGLDGFFSRRAGGPPSSFGRIADSCSDAVTFCLAPAVGVAVNAFDRPLWAPWDRVAWVAAAAVLLTGLARLVYFTLVAYKRHNFTGASTPQNAMWILVLLLLFQVPGFLGEEPALFFLLVLAFVPLMVLPISYPKLRKGAPLRGVSAAMALALTVALISSNFLRWGGPLLWLFSAAATVVSFALLVLFYLAGPLVTPKEVEAPPHGPSPAA